MGTGPIQKESASPPVNRNILSRWGHPYCYVDHVSRLEQHGDIMRLHLKQRPGHIWISWAGTHGDRKGEILADISKSDIEVSGLKVGTKVRVDFLENFFALGVHLLTQIHKISLVERLKLPLFGRL